MNFAKNIYGQFNMGFSGEKFNPRMNTIGGFIGSAMLPIAGAGAGAMLATQLDSDNIGTGALVGAGIGAAAIPLTGLAARGTYELGKAYLNGSANLIDKSLSVLKNPKIGSTLTAGIGMVANPIMRNIQGIAGFSSSLIDMNKEVKGLSDVKFTKLGKAAIGLTGAIEGMHGAINEIKKSHMGNVIPEMRTAAPQTPLYNTQNQQNPQQQSQGIDDAGATGDLVFALHRLRS